MRTTVTIDDDLLAQVRELTGLQDASSIMRDGMRALIHRESSRRLARLGGTMPDFQAPPRRRPPFG